MKGGVTLALQGGVGLVLFLYGLGLMSGALREIAGERTKKWLGRATGNRFAALGVGTAATAVLDSSSATIILAVGLIDAGLLRLEGALGVALGANVGTTVGSQILAFHITEYAGLLVIVGFIFVALARARAIGRWGRAILAFGFVLYGLEQIGAAAEPLAKHPALSRTLAYVEHPLAGVLAGAVVTAIIQSSSATVGIMIILASQGVVPASTAVAVMMGAELGTCTDVLVASIGRSRDALRLGVFQLAFNAVSVLLGLVLLGPFMKLSLLLTSDPARQIANAHVIFNVGGVALAIGTVGVAARLLRRLLPDRAGEPPARTPSADQSQPRSADPTKPDPP